MRENGDYKPSNDELKHVEAVLQLLNVMDNDHRFAAYLDEKEKTIRFDTVISFDENDRYALFNEILKKVEEKFPDYQIIGVMDTDYSEI